jgi:hypothetical protein
MGMIRSAISLIVAMMLTTGGISTVLWLLFTSQALVHQVVTAAAIGAWCA